MFMKHIALVVRDLEKSVEFYKTILGLSVSRRYKEGDAELAFMSNSEGDTEIELVSLASMDKFEGKGFFICFITDDLDSIYNTVLEKGLKPSDIRNPNSTSRYFYVYDPDGVSIQLKQNF